MICPKCGKEAGESKFCPECGNKNNSNVCFSGENNDVQIDSTNMIIKNDELQTGNDEIEIVSEHNNSNAFIKFLNKIRSNRMIFIGSICFVIVIVLLVALLSNSMNPIEKEALNYTEYIIKQMNDPESFALRSDFIHVKIKPNGTYYDGKEIIYFSYSAKNGFGGTVSKNACFFEGYFVDLENDTMKKIELEDYDSRSDYLSDAREEINRVGLVLNMQKYLIEIHSLGELSSSFEQYDIIDAKKIARKAHCDYIE